MNVSEWFATQLKASADGFVWAAQEVPKERWEVAPPKMLGEWVMARHVFHMLFYEREAVLPHMWYWLGNPIAPVEEWGKRFGEEDTQWPSHPSVEHMLAEFQQVRAEQIALLPQFDDTLWHEERNVLWGRVSIKWIVSKTFQHTAEHTHDVMGMSLYWDRYERYEQSLKQQHVPPQ